MKKTVVFIISVFFVFISGSNLFAQAKSLQNFRGLSEEQIYFGRSVTSVGDVNGDGIEDVAISAYWFNSKTGKVYIYYGGSSMNAEPDVILNGESSNDYFGCSVSTAGDVNGDGYDDVIVGAYGHNSNTGRVYIYYGGASMNEGADIVLDGEGANNYFGYSVSNAGNVNGDDYDDVIIGAYGNSLKKGKAYIYYGGSSMNSTVDVTMNGEARNNYFGRSVSYAGDVNNDGYDDVIIGAEGYNSNKGRAYIYFGGSTMNSTADVTMTGETSDSYFGRSVSFAGNVNGDSYDDVIVGASGYSQNKGKAYVYFGGSSMDATADVTMIGSSTYYYLGISVSFAGDVNNDGYDDVIVGAYGYLTNTGRAYVYFGGTSMNSDADVTMTGENIYDYFGYSVAFAGDVNNDGIDDVIVGAKSYNSGRGKAYIYFGDASMNADPDVQIEGEIGNNYFGYSVSDAGDVNNDGYDDLIVGSYGYDVRKGRAQIYFGGSSVDTTADVTLTGNSKNNYFGISVSSAGDVNGDGYDDVIVGEYFSNRARIYFGGSTMDATADVTLTGDANTYFGISVSSAGDVNKDGYDDVIVGAYGYNSSKGSAYIFYGGSSMDATADVTLTGEASNNYFGYSVSTAGDVNGDGYDDVIVGAYGYSSEKGRAYIYFGGSSMDATADVTLTGEANNNYFGYSVSTAGDVNSSNGYDDVIVGAYGYNSSKGRAYVFYGGSSMDATADVILEGEKNGDNFGYSVSCAGNVNKDYYDDVIVGAIGRNTNKGSAYIFYGGSSMNSTADVVMNGENNYDKFGYSVSNAGDVNNDGYDDFIIGAPYNKLKGFQNGKSYVYSDPNAAMPVELVNFSANLIKKNNVLLNWLTATEVNNYGFQVQRRKGIEENEWKEIGFVEGFGNSNSPKEYSFTDENPPDGKIQYRLKQIDLDGSFEYSNVVEVTVGAPEKFELFQNYPNPFGAEPSGNPTTTISYVVPSVETRHALSLQLIVYDVLGREVATLVNKAQAPGNYSVQFNAQDLPSGIYFYTLQAGNFVKTRKMILLK